MEAVSITKDYRIYYYDNLKFALILLVVIGHAFVNHNSYCSIIPAINVFINTFHMPLFIFVSGLFHSNNNVRKRVLLLISYVMLAKLISMIISGTNSLTLFEEESWPWYLVSLVIFTILTYLMRDISWKYILPLLVFIGCLAGYDSNIMSSELLGRIVVWFPFYYAGACINKESIYSLIQKRRRLLFAIGLVLLSIYGIMCLFLRNKILVLWQFIMPHSTYSDMSFYCNGFYRLVYYVVVAIIGLAFMCIIPISRISIISVMGGRTIAVYTFHLIVRKCIYVLGIADFLCSSIWGILVYILICVVETMLLSLKPFMMIFDVLKNLCYFGSLKGKLSKE